ncbi:MAG TPA: lipopolysaccharide biosynthesis protein RfbH [Terriglobales bacterium]|nr:lipopolysaccharide biosynthesis protein RfbH [Terriglobales bacterium]
MTQIGAPATMLVVPGMVLLLGAACPDGPARQVLALSRPDSQGFVRTLTFAGEPAASPHPALNLPEDVWAAGSQAARDAGLNYLVLTPEELIHIEKILRPLGALTPAGLEHILRRRLHSQVAHYWECVHPEAAFLPDVSLVPVSGKVIGTSEIQHLVDAALDGWLTTGRFNTQFQRQLARFLGVRHVLTTNSGSSANLLAISALTSPLLGDRALRPGDEVITAAAGFPTTVNPILQHGLVPVFVDVEIPTYNATPAAIEAAITPRTKAIMLAHTLGNPYDVAAVSAMAKTRGLWLIEDCCDALGSQFGGRLVGAFGDVGTLSFYPAHHITMGEGGAVFTGNGHIKRALESIRDWGRDCWCEPGKDNTCGKRFDWELGELPCGYDHKYTYSHLGYNLKITDMQAAVGLAQLQRLPEFIRARKSNYAYLRQALTPLEEFLILPRATSGADPAWFGFPVLLRETAPLSRDQLVRRLEAARVATRLLFAGNLIQQPYFKGRTFRVSGALTATDRVMRQVFWLGVFPGLTHEMLDHMARCLFAAFDRGKSNAACH